MSRYVNELSTAGDPQQVYAQVMNFIVAEGYVPFQYKDNEPGVYKKGKGIMTNPSFLQVLVAGNSFKVSCWMRIAILPGWYVGETGIKGFYAAAVKTVLRTRVSQIERIIMSAQ